MKTSIIYLSLLFCLFTGLSSGSTQNRKFKYDSTTCLQISGRVTNVEEDEDNEDCIVELINSENIVTDTLILKNGKSKFRFTLKRNSYYAIRISKKNHISKLISINTEILTDNDGIHRFSFQTRLVHEKAMKRVNPDLVDFPVAIIHFDYENDCFKYNKEYTDNLKRDLYTIGSPNEKPSSKDLLASK